METVKPVKDKVLVKIDKARTISKGGIIDPAMGKRKMPTGVVKAIGDSVVRKDVLEKRVNFDQYEGWRYDDDHILIEEKHLYMIIEKEDEDENADVRG